MAERMNRLTVNSAQLTERLAPAYNIEFDLKNPDNPHIKKNLETDLGERFNVVISRVQYEFDGQHLVAENESEPFIQTIIRGIEDHRQYANHNDRKRELAEFEGFNKIQTLLAQPKPGLGPDDSSEKVQALSQNQSVIYISPRGPKSSCYQRNFFEIFQKMPSGKVLMTQYSSQMTNEEFLEAAKKVQAGYGEDEIVNAEYFLKNPLPAELSNEKILEIFHPDYEALKEKELTELLTVCQPLINAFIASLKENPHKTASYRRALLNFADDYIFKPKARELLTIQLQDPEFVPVFASQLAARPVRYVVTGCGAQGDQLTANAQWLTPYNPYSVAEFGRSSCPDCQASANHFHCPKNKGGCGGKIPTGLGYTTCPHCGLTKEQAGSNC